MHTLPEPELDADFNDDIDRHSFQRRRSEAPLPDRLDCAFVEPARKPSQQLDVADRAIVWFAFGERELRPYLRISPNVIIEIARS